MVNFVNFTPQSWQSISLNRNEAPKKAETEKTSNPIAENRGTYPLMDARNVLIPSVSFRGIPANSNSGICSVSGNNSLYNYISDPSDGFSLITNTDSNKNTGLSYPVLSLNKTNYTKIGTESKTVEVSSKEGPRRGKNKKTKKVTISNDVYKITDNRNGVQVECLGKIDSQTGNLKITQLKSVTVKNNNGQDFIANFSGKLSDCDDLSEDAIDDLLTDFVKATTGFCDQLNGCDGMKCLAKTDSNGNRIYPVVDNGKKAKFELKILNSDNDKNEDYNFGDMRYFSYEDPKFNAKENRWEMNWACFERHSSLHRSRW